MKNWTHKGSHKAPLLLRGKPAPVIFRGRKMRLARRGFIGWNATKYLEERGLRPGLVGEIISWRILQGCREDGTYFDLSMPEVQVAFPDKVATVPYELLAPIVRTAEDDEDTRPVLELPE